MEAGMALWQAFLRICRWTLLICGGIGAGAQNALAEAGIQLYGGVSGSADDAVKALAAGLFPTIRMYSAVITETMSMGKDTAAAMSMVTVTGDHECRHGNCGR